MLKITQTFKNHTPKTSPSKKTPFLTPREPDAPYRVIVIACALAGGYMTEGTGKRANAIFMPLGELLQRTNTFYVQAKKRTYGLKISLVCGCAFEW